jgi:hypothetical protein
MKKILLLACLSAVFCFSQTYFENSKEACDYGDSDSCINVGVHYKNGMGVRKDPFKALEYFQKTCKDGNGSGCSLDDLTYFFGNGVNRDYLINNYGYHNGFYNRYHFNGYGFGYDRPNNNKKGFSGFSRHR